MLFKKILDESGREPNNKSKERQRVLQEINKQWLQDSYIETYLTHNEGMSVVVERFIRTLNNKSYKYMTSISRNVYIDKLDDIGSKYNNTYHCTIKMKPVDVKSGQHVY